MKKLISLLLAVSVMAMSSTTFAAYLGAEGQRNPGSWADTQGNRNSNALRDYSNEPKQLAVYRPGDTITFTKGDQVFAEGDVVTMISSKLDATDLTSATVMFIDQITVDSASPSFEYKIREGLTEGIYKIDIKIGSAEVDSFYYSVADPKVQILYTDEEETEQTTYVEWNDTTYYFAAATIGTDKVMYEQAGVAGFGFVFDDYVDENGDPIPLTFDAAVFDEAQDTQEIGGTVNWIFSIGIEGIGVAGVDAPVADGVIVNE